MALPFSQSSFPEIYERELVGPLFRPWAELLLEETRLAAGDRVLDVACGTGIVARLARDTLGDRGTVVGIDLSPAMLGVARAVAPDVDWREGDAAALPLRDDEQFDAVLCHQGLQFVRDMAAAMREMHRALAPGGRLAVSTWSSDEGAVLRELRAIAERHAGAIIDKRHSFGEAGPVETLLRQAGFHQVRSKTLSRTIRFPDGAVFVALNAMALVGMSERAGEMNDEERGRIVEAIVRDSAGVVRSHTDEAGFAYPIAAIIATAVRPREGEGEEGRGRRPAGRGLRRGVMRNAGEC